MRLEGGHGLSELRWLRLVPFRLIARCTSRSDGDEAVFDIEVLSGVPVVPFLAFVPVVAFLGIVNAGWIPGVQGLSVSHNGVRLSP